MGYFGCGVTALLIASVHCTTMLFLPFTWEDSVTTYAHIQKWVWFVWLTVIAETAYLTGMQIIRIHKANHAGGGKNALR